MGAIEFVALHPEHVGTFAIKSSSGMRLATKPFAFRTTALPSEKMLFERSPHGRLVLETVYKTYRK